MKKETLTEFIVRNLYAVYNIPKSTPPGEDTNMLEEIIANVKKELDCPPNSADCTCNKVSCDCPLHTMPL